MGKIADAYLRYGVPLEQAIKYESLKITVTSLRNISTDNAVSLYKLPIEEVKWIKKCITRQPIDENIVHALLENNNFVCCCCKGIKSESYIIHHIEEYEVSQDNSYDNLAVLCLLDHELAHTPSKLSNRLTPNQIKECKINWEMAVKSHNYSIADNDKRDLILSKLPKYMELQLKIDELSRQVVDKEKVISRSEAFFENEISKSMCTISELELQKANLENQVTQLLNDLETIDYSNASGTYHKAVELLFCGDLENAMLVLDEAKLEEDFTNLQKNESKLHEAYKQNADSRILKAKLLVLNLEYETAKKNAIKGLEVYDYLCRNNPDGYIFHLLIAVEQVGSIYYNSNDYEEALNIFNFGLQVCDDMEKNGISDYLSILPLMLQNIGACYYSLNNANKSIEFLECSHSMLEHILKLYATNNEIDVAFIDYILLEVLSNLGTSYKQIGDMKKSLYYYSKGIDLCDKLITLNNEKYYEGIFMYLTSFGSYYLYSGKYEDSKKLYLKICPIALKLCEDNNIKYIPELADFFRDLCAAYFLQNDYLGAKPYCDKALELYRKINTYNDIIHTHMVDALVYKMIMLGASEGVSENVTLLANEAIDICNKYPNNIDAVEYPKTINMLIKTGFKVSNNR